MNRTVLRCFARQHAVIHRAQALQAGLSGDQISYALRCGELEHVAPRVYRLAGAPPDPRSLLLATALSSNGVVSYRSAAWLHGLIDDAPPRPEVTIADGRRYRGHAIVHRTPTLERRDTTTVDGIRATNAVRTFVDLGAVLDPDELEVVLHRGLHERKLSFDRVARRFFQLASAGRSGTATVRSVLVRYDPSMAPAESTLEVLLLRILRSAGLPDPVRQHRVSVGGSDYRLDVAYPDLQIAIEGDRFGIHSMRTRHESDRARRNTLTVGGWSVLEFTWRQLCRRPAWVIGQVEGLRALRTAGR